MNKFKGVQIIIQTGWEIWKYSPAGTISDDLREKIIEIVNHPDLKAVGPFTIPKNEDKKNTSGVIT